MTMFDTNRPIHLAFLGCGFATRLHSKTLTKLGRPVRRYYASRDPGRAAGYNRKFRGDGALESYEAALEAPHVDVVLIATPPASHLDLTLRALASGKHVIVEKPPFLTSEDFETVREAKDRAGRLVMVAENYFYKPLVARLRELLESGAIGEPRFVHVNALKEQKVEDWRGDASLSGGGALFEGGIHWVNFVSSLGLRVRDAAGYLPAPRGDMEKSIMVALEYEEGAVGSLYYSWETPSLFKGLRLSKIFGRKGSITFESNGILVFVRGGRWRILFPGLRDIAGYRGMFADFLEAIRESREPRFTFDMAKRDVELIERIYRSAADSAGREAS
jgi:UDP-N-acetylglucosamine 3-dehydrogenase